MAYNCVGFVETNSENYHLAAETFSNNSQSREICIAPSGDMKDVAETSPHMMAYLNNLYHLQWSNRLGQTMQSAETSLIHRPNPPERVHNKESIKMEGNNSIQDNGSSDLMIEKVVSLASRPVDGVNVSKEPNSRDKPEVSYFAMVAKAIQQSEKGYVILNDIYTFVLKNYPYYEHAPPSWKISIRHQLSTNSCFVKVANVPGQRGYYWAIHPACKEELARGSYRTALQKVRHTTRRFLRGKRAGNRLQRYISNISKNSPVVLKKPQVIEPKPPTVPAGFSMMQSKPIPPTHPFYFLSRPECPYETYVSKHNDQSWQQEVNVIKQDICNCESQQQVLRDLGQPGPPRIFTEFAQNHLMPCSSASFDDFL